eukprot:TRINITY_DN10389_c0_g2_i3.p1 TRINITY_DN10389_c0_g2~~TRINITY_DN10389_c0_g2_i3.p1  ORF type:complete len:1202 (+),score=338.92 TRINITY_DN10389_c0_g2_i3:34-3639(+)
MAPALVEPTYAFGLKPDVADNVCYLDEQNVVYPSGSIVVIYNIDQKTQRFIHGTEGSGGFTAMAISPNRRYIALAERGKQASVTIYDLHSLKKRKHLQYAESTCTEFVSLVFSPDSKYLVTVGGAPEWSMYYWAWERSQGPMAVVKCSLDPSVPVYRATFNPQDNTHLCVTGDNILKMYRYTEGNFKQLAFQKVEGQNYLHQEWLSADTIICGTEAGKIYVFSNGDLVSEMSQPERITCVMPLSTGFVSGTASGIITIWDETETKHQFKQQREVELNEDTSSMERVHHIAMSPSEEHLVASTSGSQLYRLALTDAEMDILRVDENEATNLLAQQFHSDVITGMDVALRKPLVATASLDCSVRIWNYAENTLELSKTFQEEIHSVALHPSGHFVLVGFGDKLRLMNLLIDDIRPVFAFALRECRECRFSNGGHMFAAAQGAVIQIYSTYTFESVAILKGHNGRVRSLHWAKDDAKLFSCGIDGAVYEWDMNEFERCNECVLKSCNYFSVAHSDEDSTTYAVGSDRTLKEIKGGEIVLEARAANDTVPDAVLTQLALGASGRLVLAGTSHGTVRSYQHPLTEDPTVASLVAHDGPVTRMRLSPDNTQLFSAGEDGCLFIYQVIDKDGSIETTAPAVEWADEVLITRTDLSEKNQLVNELQRRVEELQMASEYQLRLKDMNHNEKVKEITDKFVQEKDELRRQLQHVKTERDKEMARHDEETAQTHDNHAAEIQELEHQQNQRLMAEFEKYQELQQTSERMQENYEKQIKDMNEAKDKALKELADFWENKLRQKSGQLDAATDTATSRQREADETIRQIELDADQEILRLKLRYEKQLKEERETSGRLKGDNGVLGKKLKSLQREIDEEMVKRNEMAAEQQKLHAHIKALEREIASCKKEVEERDETIQDKEKRIYDLKKKNQELEKFKFVLDYKIKELKKQIEPREQEIKNMQRQIAEMDAELARYHASTKAQDLNIAELKNKLHVTSSEEQSQRQRVTFMANMLARIRSDIQTSVELVQEPKALSNAVKSMHKKHCVDVKDESSPLDEDVQVEHNRQRQFLEKTIASLKKKLNKAEELHRQESAKIMHENVTLIREINVLRKELSGSQGEVKQLEGTLKTTRTLADMRGQTLPSKEETLQMSGILNSTVNMAHEAAQTERIIDMQKQEIRKLRDALKELELTSNVRPPSTGRLPPMEQSLVA